MPNIPTLSKAQWRKVQNDYVYAGLSTKDLADKYAVSLFAVKGRCFRGKWHQLRTQFQAGIQNPEPAAIAAQDKPEPIAPVEDVTALATRAAKHAEEDQTALERLLPVKREEFLRETIRTAEILLAQIRKRAQAVDFQGDKQLKDLIAMLADLVDTIKGPLALEADKPAPREPQTIQVNILNAVLEEADRIAGKQGRSPTGEISGEL